jgi:hypothetical protein
MSTTKVDSQPDGDQYNSGLESALSDAHTEEGRRRNWFSRAATNLFQSHRPLGLRVVWRELCSLPSRICCFRPTQV